MGECTELRSTNIEKNGDRILDDEKGVGVRKSVHNELVENDHGNRGGHEETEPETIPDTTDEK